VGVVGELVADGDWCCLVGALLAIQHDGLRTNLVCIGAAVDSQDEYVLVAEPPHLAFSHAHGFERLRVEQVVSRVDGLNGSAKPWGTSRLSGRRMSAKVRICLSVAGALMTMLYNCWSDVPGGTEIFNRLAHFNRLTRLHWRSAISRHASLVRS
jgi:hypothetical protein